MTVEPVNVAEQRGGVGPVVSLPKSTLRQQQVFRLGGLECLLGRLRRLPWHPGDATRIALDDEVNVPGECRKTASDFRGYGQLAALREGCGLETEPEPAEIGR